MSLALPTPAAIKRVRERTGYGLYEVKRALTKRALERAVREAKSLDDLKEVVAALVHLLPGDLS